MCIVEEMLGRHRRLVIDELDVIAELRIVGRWYELAIVGGQRILSVGNSASFKVVGNIRDAVIVQAVGI